MKTVLTLDGLDGKRCTFFAEDIVSVRYEPEVTKFIEVPAYINIEFRNGGSFSALPFEGLFENLSRLIGQADAPEFLS